MAGGPPDFETVEHTADVGLIARGGTVEALFANAARGMFHLIAGEVRPQPRRRMDLAVEAPDREALLVAWLNELLFRFETERVVFCEFEVHEVTDQRLAATVAGQLIDEIQQPLERELKAATYHGLSVRHTETGWQAEVLFDA